MRLFNLLFFLLATTGCFLFESSEATPEAKMAVLRVCDEYLRNVAAGQSGLSEGMIAWSDYAPTRSSNFDRSAYSDLVTKSKNKWTKDKHPLLNLIVKSASVRGDDAKIVLQKQDSEEKIQINLKWVGRGWLIVGDNIFSEDGIYRR